MLRWKEVSVPFVGGLQESVEPLLQTEGFSRLHWFEPQKDGSLALADPIQDQGLSIENALPDGTPTEGDTGDTKVIRLGDGYGYVRNGYLYVESGSRAYRRGRVSPWVVEQSCIASAAPNEFDSLQLIRLDACVVGGYLFTVYESSGFDRLYVVVTDAATGATIKTHLIQDQEFYWHWHPRIVPYDGSPNIHAALYYLRHDGENITLQRRVVTRTTVLSATDMSGNLSATLGKDVNAMPYDVWGDGSQNELLAYVNPASSGNLIVKTVVGGSTVSTETITRTLEAIVAVAVSTSATPARIPLAWAECDDGEPGNHRVYAAVRGSGTDISTTLLETFAGVEDLTFGFTGILPFVVNRIGMCGAGTDREFVAINVPNNALDSSATGGAISGDAAPFVRGKFISTAGGSITAAGVNTAAHRVQLVSRPFWDGTRACYMASSAAGAGLHAHPPGVQDAGDNRNRYFVVMAAEPGQTGTGAFPLAHFGQEYAEPCVGVDYTSDTYNSVGDTIRTTPCVESDGSVSLVGLERDPAQRAYRVMRYRLVKDDRVGQFAQLGASTYICGGLLTQWDGSVVRESGFIAEPSIQWWTTPAATSSMAAGAYGLAVTYSRINSAGELLRSRPSEIKTINLAAGDRIDVTVSPPGPSLIRTGTASTKTKASPIMVEFWLTDANSEGGPFWLVYREAHDADSSASISVSLNVSFPELLYGISLPYNGQEVEELTNDPPLSPIALAEWRNRLWLSDGYKVQYSKPYDRFRQAEFSLLQVTPKPAGPNIQALVPLGQGLATISDETGGVAMIYGDGADITGNNDSLQGPTVMQQSLGTIAPGAIGRFGGVAFVMTPSGLRVLQEGGAVARVGDAVEDSTLASPVRAVHVEGDQHVTVLHGNAAERFDLVSKTWSTLTIPSASWIGDRLGGLEDDEISSILSTEPTRVYPDDPQVVTPWYRPAKDLGEFRVRRMWILGRSEYTVASGSASIIGLRVSIAYDYSTTYHSACEIPLGQMPAGPWTFRFVPARQRCRAFRLKFDVPASALSGQTIGPTLVALRFQLGVREVAGARPGGNEGKGMV